MMKKSRRKSTLHIMYIFGMWTWPLYGQLFAWFQLHFALCYFLFISFFLSFGWLVFGVMQNMLVFFLLSFWWNSIAKSIFLLFIHMGIFVMYIAIATEFCFCTLLGEKTSEPEWMGAITEIICEKKRRKEENQSQSWTRALGDQICDGCVQTH